MSADYTAAYLAIGFVALAWVAWRDYLTAREGFWLSLVWPLTLALAILWLVGYALRRIGLRCKSGKPRNPRWAVRGVYVNKVRRPGFVATCPWWVVAVWIDAKAKGGAG
jgi:hypothetical protein